MLCIFGCMLIGCSDVTGEIPDEEPAPTEFSVTFKSEGKKYYGAVVSKGHPVAKPVKDPEKTSYKFMGWYSDEACTKLYDFQTPVTNSFTLYSKFELDIEKINEGIDKLKTSIMKISNKCFNMDKDGKETDSTTIEGIGVIFNISNGYCFMISNHHVTEQRSGYTHQKVTVTDYKGRTYTGLFYDGKGYEATSSDYDLSIVCCVYNKTDLKVAPIKRNDPVVDDIVVAVGVNDEKPVTGVITKSDLATIPMDEYLSNVTFEVLHHTASAESNEALLFDLDMALVGFTYANDNGVSYAIPTTRIYDFLYAFVYQ